MASRTPRAVGADRLPADVFRSDARETSIEELAHARFRGKSQRAATVPTAQTTTVVPTSVQKPSMWKPPTITVVSQRMNIATKNHAIPRVRIASRNVANLSAGLTKELSSPKTSAAPTIAATDP